MTYPLNYRSHAGRLSKSSLLLQGLKGAYGSCDEQQQNGEFVNRGGWEEANLPKDAEFGAFEPSSDGQEECVFQEGMRSTAPIGTYGKGEAHQCSAHNADDTAPEADIQARSLISFVFSHGVQSSLAHSMCEEPDVSRMYG